LVTTVVAWTTTPSTSDGASAAASSTARTPVKNPSMRSCGVVRVLSTIKRPESCRSTMSVKVPPISTASE
jgi:hypothetical protein